MGWESALEDAKKGHRPYLKNWSRDKFASDRAADFDNLLARIHREEGMKGKHRPVAVESASTLTPAAFVHHYEEKELPVLITGTTDDWLAQHRWTLDRLKNDFRDRRFKCGEDDDGYKIKVTMRNFIKYMGHNKDDSPLYIFDSTFDDDESAKRLLDDYRVPKYFPSNPDQVLHARLKRIGSLFFRALPPYHFFVRAPLRELAFRPAYPRGHAAHLQGTL